MMDTIFPPLGRILSPQKTLALVLSMILTGDPGSIKKVETFTNIG